MSLLDSILGQVGQNLDIASIAGKVGIDPKMAEMAVTALGMSQPEPGDTIAGAAAKTGLDPATLSQIAEQLGGAGGLDQIAGQLKDNPALSGVAGMLDRDGDGNPINDVLGMAGKLFGKN
jgi:hypothetical protein